MSGARAEEIFGAFCDFHRDNRHVWMLFERFSLQVIAAKFERYSSDAICHRIRWHMDIETLGEEQYKLNDHFTAYYARLFAVKYPSRVGFFRNRVRRTAGFDVFAEAALAERMRALL